MIERYFEVGEAFIFDMEGDGLTPTKIHCLSAKDVCGKVVFSTHNYGEMRRFLLHAKYLIGHNIIQFDVPHLERLLGIKIKAKLIDTYAISMYLFPHRPNHKLADWGVDVGIAKPEIEDWENLPLEEYIRRCEEDVKITFEIWRKMWNGLFDLYGNVQDIGRLLSYLFFKMDCARLQEKNKWLVDQEWANSVLEDYESIRQEKVNKLKSLMPKVPKKVKRHRPKNFYKKDGSFSSKAIQWISLCQTEALDPIDGPEEIDVVVDYLEGNPASPEQVKSWLFSLGWKPTEFKYVKGEDGDRFIPQVNLPHGKGICPDIKRLQEEKEPALEALEGLSVLNHRIPQIRTLLEEMDEDGYAYAGISGFTNTLRMKHARLVNMPKPERLYSKGIRASLIARHGKILVGADLSSLEDRIKQHFMWPYDPDYVLTMQTDTFDPHLTIAEMAGLLTKQQVQEYLETGAHKSIRGIAKNGNYACQYGAGVPRLMITMDVDKEVAKSVHEAYWTLNWSVKEVANDQQVVVRSSGMWLFNPLSRYYYSLRARKDVFSTLVQGTASYIFDRWLGYVMGQGYEDCLLGQFHDEFIFEIDDTPEGRKRMEKIIRMSIDMVEKELDFNVKLGCDVQFGTRYSDIH